MSRVVLARRGDAGAAGVGRDHSAVIMMLPTMEIDVGAGSRLVARNLTDVDGLAHIAADDDGVHVVVARGVVQYQWCAFGAGEPAVAPRCHGGEDRVGVPSLLCESVLVAGWVLLVFDPAQQTLLDEAVQPLGEDVASGAERLLEVVESTSAETSLTDQEQVQWSPRTARCGRWCRANLRCRRAYVCQPRGEGVASWNAVRMLSVRYCRGARHHLGVTGGDPVRCRTEPTIGSPTIGSACPG